MQGEEAYRGKRCWTLKRFIIRMRRQRWFAVLAVSSINAGLLIGGGFAMNHFEAANEATLEAELQHLNNSLFEYIDGCANVTCAEIHSHVADTLGEISVLQQQVGIVNATDWDLAGSMLYAATVMSTIGYGFLHPITVSGQNFTILFAMVAIPCVFLLFAVLGEILRDFCRWLNASTFAKYKCMSQKNGSPKQRYTVIWMAIIVMAYLMIVSEIYLRVPDGDPTQAPKTYQQAFYFSFITFTTIGFGDYVIEDDTKVQWTVLLIITVFCGLSVLSAFIAVLQNTLSKVVTKADYVILSVDEADGIDHDELISIVSQKASLAEEIAWQNAQARARLVAAEEASRVAQKEAPPTMIEVGNAANVGPTNNKSTLQSTTQETSSLTRSFRGPPAIEDLLEHMHKTDGNFDQQSPLDNSL